MLPEHLCFLIDVDEENTQPWTADSPKSRMSALKDALINFVRRKSNPGLLKHKYAIAAFSNGKVHIVLSFTSSAEEFKTAVEALEPEINENLGSSSSAEGTVININDLLSQLGTLLELENHRPVGSTMLPSRDDYGSVFQRTSATSGGRDNAFLQQQQPDSHLTRCVLLYGRSREIPVVEQSTHYIPLLHSPQCFVDILYVHLRGNEENVRCQDVFDALCQVHPFAAAWVETANSNHLNGASEERLPRAGALVLETHGSSIKLASHIALLLAHPAQRPSQDQMESLLDMGKERYALIKLSMGRDDAHLHMDNIDAAEPLPAPAPATTAGASP